MVVNLCTQVKTNFRGLMCVAGAFLIQLATGSFHGTFGNLLPYFTSYMKQTSPSVTNADLAMVFSAGGIAQGISFMFAGLVFVPLLGKRGCLMVGCVIFTISPLLTYFTLNTNIISVAFSYGVLSAGAVNIIMVPTFLIPVTWFPNHRGKVIGIVNCGFGLSSTLFTPIQTLIINPDNVVPVLQGNSSSASYFEDEKVLSNVPVALLYVAGVYALLFISGIVLMKEKTEEESEKIEKGEIFERLRSSFSFLIHHTFTRRDFYLLFLTRFLFITINCSFFAHWKSLCFTLSDDDRLISLIGGVSGVMNCLSRVVGGALLDWISFRWLMSSMASILTIVLLSTFFISEISFTGLAICIWMINALSFSHFSTIPVQTINLFQKNQNSVVQGAIGFSDTFAFATLGLVNSFIMSRVQDEKMFLWFFITLSSCSFMAIFVTAMVSSERMEDLDKKENKEEMTLYGGNVAGVSNKSFDL
eukprot:GFUD01022405.1.p1 GENE.GFUD01022405.1~~GFUD01022405.1.p1  ORF type:complete len:473 (-),score=85.93 GFUD01022405.1:37-1455(-)